MSIIAARQLNERHSSRATLQEVKLSRVLRLFLPYWKQLAAVLVLSLLAALAGLGAPLAMKSIVDQAIPARNLPLLAVMAALMVISPLGKGVLNIWQNYLNNKVGQQVMRDLRYGLFRNLQQQSMAFFTRSRAGEIIQRLTGDVQAVQSAITGTVVSVITQAVTVLTTIVILLRFNWQLTLLSMVVIPLLLLPVRKVSRLRKSLRLEAQTVRGEMSAQLAESFGVSGALLTRLFGRETAQERKFTALNENVMGLELKLSLIGRWYGMLLVISNPIGAAVIYLFGGWSVMTGRMTLGEVIAFVALVGRLYDPVTTLLNAHLEMSTALGIMKRIFEYMDLKPDITDSPGAIALPNVKGSLVFEKVHFSYRAEKAALQDISFHLEPGKLMALVGPSGAGKSTLISMIARLYDPSSGSILIDGYNTRQATLHSLRRHIAYVTQESFLFYGTIEENLRFAKEDATQQEMEDACRKAYIHEHIALLPEGYQTMVGEMGHRLSGGERQRIAIARAILKDPRILILDEATSHLDSVSEAYVQKALEQLMQGRTTLVIAHRLSTVIAADRIMVMEDGRIVEQGTHNELLHQEGLYAQLFRTQFA